MIHAVYLWIWLCALLNCAGWILSAFHQLNVAGYSIVLLLGLGVLLAWRRRQSADFFPRPRWRKLGRRFRRAFPAAFLALAGLALLGGVLHAPTNYDALAYRVPRVLHWLADGRWHWIDTMFQRVNTRACGFEWISVPLIALIKTDRLLFLINFVSFLLLPGLVFSVFTRLGVRRRAAWHWMWIAPTGYCFILQAASIGNDLFGAPFVLAAVDFALRARTSRTLRDLFTSILAAALMTGAKTSNVTLLLPWAVAILPSLSLLKHRLPQTAAVGLIALGASFFPMAALNLRHGGDWAGLKFEGHMPRDLPVSAGTESALVILQNLTPPVFPFASAWNRAVKEVLPPKLRARLSACMEIPGSELHLDELQMEENAGLGSGVSVLLLVSVAAAVYVRRRGLSGARPGTFWQSAVRLAPLVSLGAIITQANLTAIGRILAPYYLLLLPAFLAGPAHEWIVRRRWWRGLALIVFVPAAGLVVVSPARPLFPVGLLLENIHAAAAHNPRLAQVEAVYSVYSRRSDAFADARAALPEGLTVLGLVTSDDPETSLWRPFGSRRVEHVLPRHSAADLNRRGIHYVLVNEDLLRQRFDCSLDEWLQRMNGRVIRTIPIALRASRGPVDWHLVELR